MQALGDAVTFAIPVEDFVPAGPERAVAVGHAAQEVLSDIAHASRHAGSVAAARKAASPERIRFALLHTANHIGGAIAQQNSSISNLVQLDPRAGDELAKLRDTASPRSSWEYAPPGPARHKTPAHLAQTVLVALTHCRQHVTACQDAKNAENLSFDLEHLLSHIAESLSHQAKYIGAVAEIFPTVAAELRALGAIADVGGIIKVPAADRAFAGLSLARERCDFCGELSPCVDLDCPGSGACGQSARQRAHDQLAAHFAAGSRWDL